MTKLVCLLGSPREGGNSDTLARVFCDAAKAEGATVRTHSLRDLRFQGCMNVRFCKVGGDFCGLDDDMVPVLADLGEADVLVMATPVYFCNMTGLMKQAFDRFFSFLKPDYLTSDEPSRLGRGKRLVLIQTQGEDEAHYADLLAGYAPALEKLGFEKRDLLRACGVRDAKDVMNNAALLGQARELGRQVAHGA
ncbi:flavodoxin family protein [Roseovarius aestuariivivens]|uniref:flavodoxin family protein n=1 Tax=Roseovarius aestuariivivens TaxID=1888910 RepID=UPI001080F5CF|nr:flavodoxin family protein [Roseovarius aestuariivivens]